MHNETNGRANASRTPSPKSLSPSELSLARAHLRAAGRADADQLDAAAVVVAFEAWRASEAAAATRRIAERDRQLRDRLLAPLRDRLAKAGVDVDGLDEHRLRARAAELDNAERERQAERQRIANEHERRRRADRLFADAAFPARHAADLDALPDAGSPAKWVEYRDQVDRQVSSGRGCLVGLLGISGTGKTQLATVIGYRASRRQTASRYIKAADLFRDVRRAYVQVAKGERGVSESQIMDGWASVPLLVVDELHQRAGTAAELDTIVNLIDRRYDARRATILIANQTPEDFQKGIGPSVSSRFVQVGRLFNFAWPGLRHPEAWD